jgi:hypothetical protein
LPEDVVFDAALVCSFGHVVNIAVNRFPHRVETRCSRCGSEVIRACAACETPIRGAEVELGSEGVFLTGSPRSYRAPAHCHNCGEPFPWIQEILRYAEEQASALSPSELVEYKKSLEMLAREHPASPGAAVAVRRLHEQLANEGVEMIRAVLANILGDVIMRSIFPGR